MLSLQKNLTLILITSLSMIYFVELLITIQYSDNYTINNVIMHTNESHLEKRMKQASKLGISFDRRSKMEVIQSYTSPGDSVLPNFHPYVLVRDKLNNNGLASINDTIFPLGGISNKVSVGRNETGQWMIYLSDEYGFNNPPNSFLKKVDAFLVGDSYTEGESVANDENIASLLRENEFDVYNCGMAGNGFLVEYATIVEYATKIKPHNVFWIYSANDFSDLKNELESELLIQYLNNPNYSQDLINKQLLVDSLLKKYLMLKYQEFEEIQKNREKKSKWSLVNFAKLTNTRILIYRARRKFDHFYNSLSLTSEKLSSYENESTKTANDELLLCLREIFVLSKTLINGWGGKFYFVYLPSGNTYLDGKDDPFRDQLILLINDLQIDFIDFKNDFVNHPDPLSLFPLRSFDSHYNKNGYKIVADKIINTLKYDKKHQNNK
jgi:hypothetical protein